MAIVNQFPAGGGIKFPDSLFAVITNCTTSMYVGISNISIKVQSAPTSSNSVVTFVALVDFTGRYYKDDTTTDTYLFKKGNTYSIKYYKGSSYTYFTIKHGDDTIYNGRANTSYTYWNSYLLYKQS